MNNSERENKGRKAERTGRLPAGNLKDLGKGVMSSIKNDHVQIVAAGVGFYFFMSLFPILVAGLSIYGLVLDPADLQEHISVLSNVLPSKAAGIIESIMDPIVSKPDQTLGWGLALSILLSIWSANKGTSALFEGVNIAYNEVDTRSFIKKTFLTLLFTIGGLIMGFVAILVVVLYPAFIDWLPLSSNVQNVLSWGRWFLLALIIVVALGLIYKKAPDRDNNKTKWLSLGSVIAATLWILGSLLFSWYVNNFGSYDDMYGSFAAVIIMLLWL